MMTRMWPRANANSAAVSIPVKQLNLITQQQVSFIMDNWNMYDEDVM